MGAICNGIIDVKSDMFVGECPWMVWWVVMMMMFYRGHKNRVQKICEMSIITRSSEFIVGVALWPALLFIARYKLVRHQKVGFFTPLVSMAVFARLKMLFIWPKRGFFSEGHGISKVPGNHVIALTTSFWKHYRSTSNSL